MKRQFFNRARVRMLMFVLAGVLLAASAAVYLAQLHEGSEAAENAQALLDACGLAPTEPPMKPEVAAEARAAVPAGYSQPEAPGARSADEITNILKTDLQGYTVIARLTIEKLHLHLPVLSVTSHDALKVSVCYYSGPDPDTEGNLVITGHNYRNDAHFGRLDEMGAGDCVSLTDTKGNTCHYAVYATELITPDDTAALDKTLYGKELTLLTCQTNGNRRLLIRCRQVESKPAG